MISDIEKSSEMLNAETFWGIIHKSLAGDDEEERLEILRSEINKLTPKEMIGFRLRTDKCLYDSYRSELWCAGYLMNGGCSDDGFEYFRLWVISQGKETFESAIKHPDSLASLVDGDDDYYEFEDLWYVAMDPFKERTGEDLYDYIDYENFTTREGEYPDIELNWDESRDSMMKICPQLTAKCWPEE